MTQQHPDGSTGVHDDGEGEPARRRHRPRRDGRRAAARATPRATTSERNITDLVEQPAKVMRIGGMIRQLLEEVKSAPLDEASRARLAGIYQSSIKRARGRPGPGARRGARAALAPLQLRHPVRGRAADRAGAARRLARGPLPRHPDRDLRPAGGRPGPARADAPGPAARDDARATTVPARRPGLPAPRRGAGQPRRDVPGPYDRRPWRRPAGRHVAVSWTRAQSPKASATSRSIRPASSRSLAVTPPAECVDSVNVSVV